MPNITITLTDTQKKAMDYAAVDPEDYFQNWATVRSTKAIKEIQEKLYKHCNANSIAIATGESAQVDQAFTLKLVEKGVDVQSNYTPPVIE